ncbi:ABC transporter ATP-binding protein, partial [Patescibacteria group bacterium]|nr:ABC transporter ATP-binding protein [Patescibacteria group bacterium]MBU1891035.1 ABC transporter ATP-binding protein [Patescibacteria group bacterium]
MSTIEVKDFKKHYGKVKAVDGVSFNVEPGEIFGFLGPNGAGKTTTIRTMMDFMRPTAGKITILGLDSVDDTVQLKGKIGYLSGEIRLYSKWTGKEHIDFVRSLNSKKKDTSKELIGRFGLDPSVKTKQLSTGNRQKLGIIMALMLEPEVLIMDEPTTGLDPLLQNTVYDLLREVTQQGSTVFVSSHNLAEVDKMCDKVGIIKNGKMVAIESVQSLKQKRMHIAEAHFETEFNKNDFAVEGISV